MFIVEALAICRMLWMHWIVPCLQQSAAIKSHNLQGLSQCYGEAGQRSPVELPSGLPRRVLLTVLLLVHALAWQPGFGMPLDRHTYTHTHTGIHKQTVASWWRFELKNQRKWCLEFLSSVEILINVLNTLHTWYRPHTTSQQKSSSAGEGCW